MMAQFIAFATHVHFRCVGCVVNAPVNKRVFIFDCALTESLTAEVQMEVNEPS